MLQTFVMFSPHIESGTNLPFQPAVPQPLQTADFSAGVAFQYDSGANICGDFVLICSPERDS